MTDVAASVAAAAAYAGFTIEFTRRCEICGQYVQCSDANHVSAGLRESAVAAAAGPCVADDRASSDGRNDAVIVPVTSGHITR